MWCAMSFEKYKNFCGNQKKIHAMVMKIDIESYIKE